MEGLARIGQPLRELKTASGSDDTKVNNAPFTWVTSAAERLKVVTRGSADRVIQGSLEHMSNYPNSDIGKPEFQDRKDWVAEEEANIRRMITLLVELYSSGRQAAAKAA